VKVYLGEEPNRALLLRASLATDGQAMTALLDAIVGLLTGKERRQ
jgi:hypothetical protein